MTSSIDYAASRRSTLTVVIVLLAAVISVPDASAAADSLPLGDRDLQERRTTQTLGEGVTLTRIVRGSEPADPGEIQTTTRGPWVVHVLRIDTAKARGRLAATYGPDLAHVERTTDLVRRSGALAGVNASFFTFTANNRYPGDPVGLGIYSGRMLSEPTGEPNEANMLVDSNSNRVLFGQFDWSGKMRNRRTEEVLGLEFINHPPVVPEACAELVDQTRCDQPGDVVEFTPEFAPKTPTGKGVEVVLDRRGCVVATHNTRGTTLKAGQTSLQATGADTTELLEVAGTGCLNRTVTLRDENGRHVPVRPGLFAVNGRYRLVADGKVVVPDGSGGFFARHPRTIAGTTRDGAIVLATIDGRQSTSVGTTMAETAAVAEALEMHDAINLDGGGSTTMSVEGRLINEPSGSRERTVGDALIYRDALR